MQMRMVLYYTPKKEFVKMRFSEYALITRAVEEGVAYGVNRAYKHTDNPDTETLRDTIEQEVMNALCEILVFESGSMAVVDDLPV